MKKCILSIIALSLVTLGLTACRNRVTLVETSYLVTHPAVHKGDYLTFQIPSATEATPYYVHFAPSSTPCADSKIVIRSPEPTHCKVDKEVSTLTQYLYYVDKVPKTMPLSKCPPCWPGRVVVGPSPVHGKGVTSTEPSGPYPASEILIYADAAGNPLSNTTTVYPDQAVRWFENGTDKGWTVKFLNAICDGQPTVTQAVGEEAYCNLTNVAVGTYKYQITVGKNTGPYSQLQVILPPAPLTSSNTQ